MRSSISLSILGGLLVLTLGANGASAIPDWHLPLIRNMGCFPRFAVVDVASGASVLIPEPPEGKTVSATFRPNEKCLFLWQLPDGAQATPVLYKVTPSGQMERAMALEKVPASSFAPHTLELSPDMKRIAALTQDGRLLVIDAATQACHPIELKADTGFYGPEWIGNDRLLLSSTTGISLVSLPSMRIETVYMPEQASSHVETRVSPDCKWTVLSEYADKPGQIVEHKILNLSTKEVTPLATQEEGTSALEFAWSPSGKYVAQIGPIQYRELPLIKLKQAVSMNISIFTPECKRMKETEVKYKDCYTWVFVSDEKVAFVRSETGRTITLGILDWQTGQYEERSSANLPEGYMYAGIERYAFVYPVDGGNKLVCMLVDDKDKKAP